MCFPGRGHISQGKCVSLRRKHISLVICVSRVGEHIPLVIYVSRVGEHIPLVIYVSWVGEHIPLGICVSRVGQLISLVIVIYVFQLGKTYHYDMVSPLRETNFPSDMCFPGRGTHITVICVPLSGKHIFPVIYVSQVGEHI